VSEILYTEALSVGYGEKTVVANIALHAEAGKLLCLIGPNGAGKSTLLKTLTRMLPPLRGAVYLEGKRLSDYPERALARRSAAVLTGRPEPELMRCSEVVAAGRYPYTGRLGLLSEADRRIVRECMEKVGVAALSELDFNRLSDGQRQRVLLARALCQEPKLLILDEPTSFLDIRHKLEFLELLRALARERKLAVVMSMHELELAQRFADTLLCIRDGRVDRMGSPEEVFSGDYMEALYGLAPGSWQNLFGTAEARRVPGKPRVFVIGGGGSGIQVYRRLCRLGIPFAAGVLPENDLDTPTARALAARLITDRPNEPVSAARVDEALAVLNACEYAVCTTGFGSVNAENRRLLEAAQQRGSLCAPDALEVFLIKNSGIDTIFP